MNQQSWAYNPYNIVNDTFPARIISPTIQPLNNPMPYQYAINNGLHPINTVPMNINQPLPMYWPVTQRLPPFNVLKTAIDFNLGRYPRNMPKPPLVLSAAALTGQPLIYQPSLINSQQFIERQQAMLYGNGVFLSNAPRFRLQATRALNTNMLQRFPQNHQISSNMSSNSTSNTKKDLMPQSPTQFNCFAGGENSSIVHSALPVKYQTSMKKREGKIQIDNEEKTPKTATKRKYYESFGTSAMTCTPTNESLALTSNDQTINESNNGNDSQYRFDGPMESDNLGL